MARTEISLRRTWTQQSSKTINVQCNLTNNRYVYTYLTLLSSNSSSNNSRTKERIESLETMVNSSNRTYRQGISSAQWLQEWVHSNQLVGRCCLRTEEMGMFQLGSRYLVTEMQQTCKAAAITPRYSNSLSKEEQVLLRAMLLLEGDDE